MEFEDLVGWIMEGRVSVEKEDVKNKEKRGSVLFYLEIREHWERLDEGVRERINKYRDGWMKEEKSDV